MPLGCLGSGIGQQEALGESRDALGSKVRNILNIDFFFLWQDLADLSLLLGFLSLVRCHTMPALQHQTRQLHFSWIASGL